ncbi:MAG: L-aspartate oxidase [Firmicutes bacterium]|nr:L-aspartate oxidase [Bacillota bacterium]
MKTDILIVGSGCSGLYAALHLPQDKQITIITKADLESSDSFLAQGGICMLRDEDDYNSYFQDTMKAGHYENNRQSVDIMIRESQRVIADLISYGADFEREADGSLAFTKEGAHSEKRILFHEDVTGKEITSKLLRQAENRPNITLMEYTTMVDLIEENNVCYGAVLRLADGHLETMEADFTFLACGGIGGLYRHSTNFRHLTGDALAIAIRHNIRLENINYVQIHPTTFYTENEEERSFLISESVRGEGALLYNKNMERFVDELQPRDVVTKAILKQMEIDGTNHVWEDMRPIPEEEMLSHFPNIVAYCREHGYDPVKECIPVVPAQHYFMGGIKVDSSSATSMPQLYAIGETACNGVHGRNRLASNSLLESLVFASRAATDVILHYDSVRRNPELFEKVRLEKYENAEEYGRESNELVLKAIEQAEWIMTEEEKVNSERGME